MVAELLKIRQTCMATLLLVVTLSYSLAANAAAGYFIGNSLTEGVKVEGLSAMADSHGTTFDTGIHWLRGAPLNNIWQAPDDYMLEPSDFGGFANALANNAWDFVSLQPYLGTFGNATFGVDAERLINFIDLTLAGPSNDTKFYIFTSFPKRSSGDYQAAWTQSVPEDVDQETVHARQYYEQLRQHLLDHYGQDSPIFIIPVGEVLNELDIRFKAGEFPGFTGVFEDLYVDNLHLNSEFGNWIAANTVFATLLREDPTGIVKPAGYYGAGGSDPLSPDQSIQFQEIIWNIVATHPHAGGPFPESDVDNDGVPDATDNCPLIENTDQEDFDDDSLGDACDTDDDDDGVPDVDDIFPYDGSESEDTDSDGLGNNADQDDDGDGVLDSEDAFPLDPAESQDTDADGVGDNADSDDDGDGIADDVDTFPLDSAESIDTDGDGTGNNADLDDDGDGISDSEDAFPLDPTESRDTDGDGVGDNADSDDDGDGIADAADAFPLNSAESIDTDSDGTGNNADTDDDGDGVPDRDDAFPLDSGKSQNSGAQGTAGLIGGESSGSSLGLTTLILLLLLAVKRNTMKVGVAAGSHAI